VVSAEECLYTYQQLVMMLQELGMDDVVRSVEEEWTTLDAITGEEMLIAEGADSLLSRTDTPRQKKQRRSHSQKSASQAIIQPQLFSNSDEPASIQGDFAHIPLSERLYPPRRRVLLLINAIEYVLVQPVFQGLSAMNMLKQDEVRFEDPHQNLQAFTLTRATLQQKEPEALAFLQSLQALRKYIDPLGEQDL
jgi:hypothetical protein